MADQGPASGTAELSLQTGTAAGVFLEVHTQNNFQTPAAIGIPGGTSGPASALNNVAPGDFQSPTDASAYGTKSDGSAVTPVFIANFTGGTGNQIAQGLFRMKNPAAFEAFQLSEIL